jgi:hypothetical protein
MIHSCVLSMSRVILGPFLYICAWNVYTKYKVGVNLSRVSACYCPKCIGTSALCDVMHWS